MGNQEKQYGASHWKAVFTYLSIRDKVMEPSSPVYTLAQKRDELKELLKWTNYWERYRFRPAPKEAAIILEARIIYRICIARLAVDSTLVAGKSSQFAQAYSYARHALMQYDIARRLSMGTKGVMLTELDIRNTETLRSQIQFLQKNRVVVDQELLKSLESRELSP